MSSQSPDYQPGYAAGRRREDRDERDRQRAHAERLGLLTLAAAIAPKVMDHPWTAADGKRLNNAEGMAKTIVDLVRAIDRRL